MLEHKKERHRRKRHLRLAYSNGTWIIRPPRPQANVQLHKMTLQTKILKSDDSKSLSQRGCWQVHKGKK